jgi:hypothetical protein
MTGMSLADRHPTAKISLLESGCKKFMATRRRCMVVFRPKAPTELLVSTAGQRPIGDDDDVTSVLSFAGYHSVGRRSAEAEVPLSGQGAADHLGGDRFTRRFGRGACAVWLSFLSRPFPAPLSQ